MPKREDAIFYQLDFQQPGIAEAELERDERQAFVELLGNPSAGTVVVSNKRTSRSLSPRGKCINPPEAYACLHSEHRLVGIAIWNSQEREVARKCRDPDPACSGVPMTLSECNSPIGAR